MTDYTTKTDAELKQLLEDAKDTMDVTLLFAVTDEMDRRTIATLTKEDYSNTGVIELPYDDYMLLLRYIKKHGKVDAGEFDSISAGRAIVVGSTIFKCGPFHSRQEGE